MAPTHIAVAANPDANLVREFVAASYPLQAPAKVAEELLARLARVRLRREARGLNHWDEYAPDYLQRLLARQESRRRRSAERFIAARHADLVDFAQRISRDPEIAQRAVARVCLDLLAGKTRENLIFRALKLDVRNEMQKSRRDRRRMDSLDALLTRRFAFDGDGTDLRCEIAPEDFASSRPEDRDPLDILIAQEDEAERRVMLAQALSDPRWRYLKRRKWAETLRGCADSASARE
jgi:hypothetical protein